MIRKITTFLLVSFALLLQTRADETIPFRMLRGAMIFDVEIAGKTYPFLFDSGGTCSISKEFQEQLNLQPVSEMIYRDSQGNYVKTSVLAMPDFRMGQETYSGLSAIQLDIRNIAGMNCYGIVGVLGPELMKDRVWQLDFERQEVTISDQAIEPQEGDYVVKMVKRYNGQPWLHVSVGQSDSLLTCFDTGSNGTLLLNQLETGDLTLSDGCDDIMVECGLTGTGGGGYGKADTLVSVRLKEGVRLGDMPIHDVVINHAKGKSNIMGIQLMRRYAVTLDCINDHIIFAPRPYSYSATEVFPVNFGYRQERIIVSSVKAHTFKDLPKIPFGSQILAVNGMAFPDKASPDAFCELLNSDYRDRPKLSLKLLLPNGRKKKIVLKRIKGL